MLKFGRAVYRNDLKVLISVLAKRERAIRDGARGLFRLGNVSDFASLITSA